MRTTLCLSLLVLMLIACADRSASAVAAPPVTPRQDLPPRKIIVGTVNYGFWRPYPGVEARTAELVALIDRVQAAAQAKYGRPADIVALPEEALTAGRRGSARERALPFDGAVREAFTAVVRKYNCYLVLPMDLLEGQDRCSNALLLLGRDGSHVGTYRKVHLVYDEKTKVLEGGMTPAWEVPVFMCDFGRVGLQICWDMEFDSGWKALQEQGADLVIWSSMAPFTVMPRLRAMTGDYYIVSSQWRDNATVFEPTGLHTAQIRSPDEILVQELDLSYAVIGWSGPLGDGKGFSKVFGERIGFRYSSSEDSGIFWSNDPGLTIGAAMKQIGVRGLNEMRRSWRSQYAAWEQERPAK